jgi:DNA-binding transcriptional MerR regulator
MEKAPDAFRTISEVAQDLNLPQHVLRFWETRFSQIKPMKRGGGRRYYRPDDVDLLRGIRHLLYGEGYTIRGVQRILKDEGGKFVQAVWKTDAPRPPPAPTVDGVESDEPEEGELQNARGLLGLWPTLLGTPDGPEEDDASLDTEQIAPAIADRDETGVPERSECDDAVASLARNSGSSDDCSSKQPSTLPAPGRELHRDAILKLEATLFELGECRRLIDAALVMAER